MQARIIQYLLGLHAKYPTAPCDIEKKVNPNVTTDLAQRDGRPGLYLQTFIVFQRYIVVT
jgi:hypothetical protein